MDTSSSDGSTLNRGPSVLVASWTLIGVSTLFVLARGAARRRLTKVESGDILLPVALVFAFAQTACVQAAVDHGLGRQYQTLDVNTKETYLKFIYCAQLLWILVLGITKTSVVLITLTLQPRKSLVTTCYIVLGIVVTSTLACLLTSAFQCSVPSPWKIASSRCIDMVAFSNSLFIINIVTDLLVVALPIVAIYFLPVNRESRWFISTLCSCRFLVPTFIIVQICWLQTYTSSTDLTYDIVPLQVWTQVVLNISIVTACVPSIGGLLTEMMSGVTGRRIVLGDAAFSRSSKRYSHRQSGIVRLESDKDKQDQDANLSKLEDLESAPASPQKPQKKSSSATLNTQRSKSRLSQFSWFGANKPQNYVIANDLPVELPASTSPRRPERPEKEEILAILTPAYTHDSRDSTSCDISSEFTQSRPNTANERNALLEPGTEASQRPISGRGRWSFFISNTATISRENMRAKDANLPNVSSHARITSSPRSSRSSRSLRSPRSPRAMYLRPNLTPSRKISNPAFLHSSAPVLPLRSPSRPLPIPHRTSSSMTRQNTTSSTRSTTSGVTGKGANAGHEYKPSTNASYRSHKSKVSNVSQYSQGERVEEVPSAEGDKDETGQGTFVDVDLEFERCRRL